MRLIDAMMDTMVKGLSQDKREEMMVNMMPMMMEGIDVNTLMPKMMTQMFEDVTVDDVVNYLKEALKDQEALAQFGAKLQAANLMQQMMFRVDTSRLPFEETVTQLKEAAQQNGWVIPDSRDLQHEYHQAGLSDMTRCTVIYFCDPQGGYSVLKNDEFKAMSVMMPMGVSVYETSGGQVEIAAMNLGLMSNFFSGVVKDVLIDGGERYQKSIATVVETGKNVRSSAG